MALAAASVLSAGLGSVHAFSLFLEPLEAVFGATRASVSLTYSLALVSLTVLVLTGHKFYGWRRPPVLALLAGFGAALGTGIAAVAPALWTVWLGYGVVFGAANGLGYGFGLQIAARANPGREGFAMGVVTAAYALGAAVAPGLIEPMLDWGGFTPAMGSLALALALIGAVSAWMFHLSAVRWEETTQALGPIPRHGIPLLWLGYGAGVAAGLMAIGHAAGLASVAGVAAVWAAPAIIAVCNLTGSLAAGQLMDRWSPRGLLGVLPLISVLALGALALRAAPMTTLIGLGAVGFAYGGIIAAYPAAIAKRFGAAGPAVYGRVFTAWGAAGLAAPWLAGAIYDRAGEYSAALWVAAALGLLSAGMAALRATPLTRPPAPP